MELKKTVCQYCAAQGIKMQAVQQKQEALVSTNTRVGCENGHFFAVSTKDLR